MTGGPEAPHTALDALDRRLDPGSAAPLAVGLSGGGDSLALLLLARHWAKLRDRPVLALTVDHQIHPDSAGWTAQAGETAGRLGARWRPLPWTGPKPLAGLPAAARRARHALLAQAACEAGARVLLLGHTADDRAESALIRAQTPSHGTLGEWSPSPVWPEGRGVFLLRPLLEVRREALRAWLRALGLPWLDDPANADLRFARPRARAALAGMEGPEPPAPPSSAEPGERCVTLQASAGALALDRAALLASPRPAALLAKAVLCVGGGERPPRGAAVQGWMARLKAGERFAATLAGAQLRAEGDGLLLVREPGRSPPPPVILEPGEAVVFDGRFTLLAEAPGWTVAPLAGRIGRLPDAERRGLAALPAAARPSLPAILGPGGEVRLPRPFGSGPAGAESLVEARLKAALGEIADEAALRRNSAPLPHGGSGPLILS